MDCGIHLNELSCYTPNVFSFGSNQQMKSNRPTTPNSTLQKAGLVTFVFLAFASSKTAWAALFLPLLLLAALFAFRLAKVGKL